MSGAINMLVRSFLQKQSIEECTVEELQALASEYPYSEAAQLLLAKKLYGAQATAPGIAEKYDEQLQKTLLLFQNPLWVQHLINEREVDGVMMVGSTEDQREFMPPEVTSSNDVETGTHEIPVPEVQQQEEAKAPPIIEFVEHVPETVEQNQETVEQEPETIQPVSETEQISSFVEGIPAPEQISEPVADESVQQIPEPEQQDSEPKIEAQESVTMPEESNEEPAELPFKPMEVNLGTNEGDKALTFEPYHTVDYFASQGIKYTPEEIPKDKFSQQLKSFTEWLKAMKRLPVTESDLPRDEAVGKQVEQLAQHSIQDRLVVTETMAEVWVKQGNLLKAIEVYEKLSLLDPSKSGYFAAKIDSLKIQ